jgi:diguanylate cyclase (GGDEF)-like protein
MTRALPWHLNGASTYHNNTECPLGTSGDVLRYALGGTGEKAQCPECQQLNEGDAPRVRLAAVDGVVAEPDVPPAASMPAIAPARQRDLAGLLRGNVIAAVAYAVVTLVGEGYFRAEGVAPPFVGNPAVALLSLLIFGIRAWPGILLGALAANLAVLGFPPGPAVLHAAVTTVAATGAAALMRFRSRARRPALTLVEVLRLLAFGVVAYAAVLAAGHFAVDLLAGRAGDATFALTRGFVHGVAKSLISIPAVMLLWVDRRPLSRDRWLEMAAIATLVILLSSAHLWSPQIVQIPPSMSFAALFVCTWLSMRFPQREGFVLFSFAMIVATLGTGIEAPTDATSGNGLIVGFSVAVCMINVLLVSALAEERRVSMMLAGAHALTGAASRISFFDRARQEAARVQRHGQALTVAAFDLDVDPSATLEETHERSAALGRNMAGVIIPQLRRRDVLAHLGHEEFMLLMPKTALGEAQAICEYLRRAVTEAGAGAPGRAPSVSFGLTAYDPASDTVESCLRRAKQALRLAKEIGGNRVAAA